MNRLLSGGVLLGRIAIRIDAAVRDCAKIPCLRTLLFNSVYSLSHAFTISISPIVLLSDRY